MLIILYVILVEYTEGHHDKPLVTLLTVTELDLCCNYPDGMLNDIRIFLYQGIVINQYINNRRYYETIIMLIILYIILVEYAEGHYDLPLVTLFAVTKVDLCRHDPDGISKNIIININYERCEKDSI